MLLTFSVLFTFPVSFEVLPTRTGQFPPTTGRLTYLWHRCSTWKYCHNSSTLFFDDCVFFFFLPSQCLDGNLQRREGTFCQALCSRKNCETSKRNQSQLNEYYSSEFGFYIVVPWIALADQVSPGRGSLNSYNGIIRGGPGRQGFCFQAGCDKRWGFCRTYFRVSKLRCIASMWK